MFQPELYDRPPTWWEEECVRYGLNHMKHRLKTIMGTHVVRLTDREYMIHFAAKLQELHETQQRSRIEMRKMRPATIVPQLRGRLPVKKKRRKPHYCESKKV
ncbi:hypothetical protein HN011_003277 [Eciton burchellii]|nr:hypothetical protein HN011_003277 [Eciton burchellii]